MQNTYHEVDKKRQKKMLLNSHLPRVKMLQSVIIVTQHLHGWTRFVKTKIIIQS